MSRDARVKLIILAGTALVGAGLLLALGLKFSLRDNLAALGVVGTLGPVALFYHQRRTAEFVMSLVAVMQVMVFFSCFTLVMYGAAALSFPLVDDTLVSLDQMLGVHVPSIVAWANSHPTLKWVLHLAYQSTILQTLVVILVLGFAGRRRRLESFVLQFMLSLCLTVFIFCFAPAEGPFAAYGYEASPQQTRYLDHFRTLRSGERTEVVLKEAEGLVTFPSFHTTWAILLMLALRGRRRWFLPAVVLNAAVIVATLTTGWHYFSDVMGGVALAVVVILLTRQLEPWLNGFDQDAGSLT